MANADFVKCTSGQVLRSKEQIIFNYTDSKGLKKKKLDYE